VANEPTTGHFRRSVRCSPNSQRYATRSSGPARARGPRKTGGAGHPLNRSPRFGSAAIAPQPRALIPTLWREGAGNALRRSPRAVPWPCVRLCPRRSRGRSGSSRPRADAFSPRASALCGVALRVTDGHAPLVPVRWRRTRPLGETVSRRLGYAESSGMHKRVGQEKVCTPGVSSPRSFHAAQKANSTNLCQGLFRWVSIPAALRPTARCYARAAVTGSDGRPMGGRAFRKYLEAGAR